MAPTAPKASPFFTVFMAAGEEAATTLPFSVGEDHDRFVRTAEGWKFVARQ